MQTYKWVNKRINTYRIQDLCNYWDMNSQYKWLRRLQWRIIIRISIDLFSNEFSEYFNTHRHKKMKIHIGYKNFSLHFSRLVCVCFVFLYSYFAQVFFFQSKSIISDNNKIGDFSILFSRMAAAAFFPRVTKLLFHLLFVVVAFVSGYWKRIAEMRTIKWQMAW